MLYIQEKHDINMTTSKHSIYEIINISYVIKNTYRRTHRGVVGVIVGEINDVVVVVVGCEDNKHKGRE